MSTPVSATEAARRFSDLLNRVRYRGERFVIVRNGEEIAELSAVAPRSLDLLIDTSVLVAIERKGVRPEVLLESFADRRAAIAAITVSELLHGVNLADTAVHRGEREHFVEETLAVFPVLDFDLDTARVHGQLWADLSRIGQAIGLTIS